MEKKQSNVKFILSHSGKHKFKIFAAAFFSVLQSLMVLVPYVLMYEIFQIVKYGNKDMEMVKLFVYSSIIAAVLSVVFTFLSLAFSHIAAFSILHEIRIKAVNHMGNLNMGFFKTRSSGEIKKALDEDVEKLELFIAHHIPDLVEAIITPLAIIIYLFFINWIMALVLFIPLILMFLLQALVMKGYSKRMSEYMELLSRLNSTIIQFIQGINIFKAFNLTAKRFKKYSDTTEEYFTLWSWMTKTTMGLFSLYFILVETGLVFIIPIGGLLYLSAKLGFSGFVMFILLVSVFLRSFYKLMFVGQHLSMLTTGAENIRNIMEKEEQQSRSNIELTDVKGLIEFDQVSFTYTDKEVLTDISLAFPAGTTTALVGPSGSGKTTMGLLVGRFWDINKGSIKIDGKDIRDLTMESLMSNTAFVFQDVFMLNDTVLNNIKLGLNKTEDEVIEAAKKAQIHDFIQTMENGYNTIVGEGSGIKMSGGEMQRISIARAILKDPKILVLDEVTAYSDIDNETRIQVALKELTQNKTVLIIAHRLYTIMNANNIVVLDEGKIVEQGTHSELMNQKGLYQKLWNISLGGNNVKEN